jgi:hypothetical protein
MDYLSYPTKELWQKREEWFYQINERYAKNGSYLVSEQACALIGEVQIAFCAGAWLAVIILAVSVIEAQFRELDFPDIKNFNSLINASLANPHLHILRQRRNRLVHLDPEHPAITIDLQWADRDTLEQEAKDSIQLMFESFYLTPCI